MTLTIKELRGSLHPRTGDVDVRGVIEHEGEAHPLRYGVSPSDPLSTHEGEISVYEGHLSHIKANRDAYAALAGTDLSTPEVSARILWCHVVIGALRDYALRITWAEGRATRSRDVPARDPINLPSPERVLEIVRAEIAARYPSLPPPAGNMRLATPDSSITAVQAHLNAIAGLVPK